MKITSGCMVFLACCLLCVSASQTWAYNQNPNLDIGCTNIMGAVMAPPGLHMLNYMAYYSSDDLKDGKGNNLPGDNELDVMVYTPQLIYSPNLDLPKDVRIGLSAMLPLQNINMDSSIGLQENHNILGDLAIGPFIGSAIPLGDAYNLHWFFELDTYLPIGNYDSDKDLNPSANYITLNPFLSLTLQMPNDFAVSTRQFFSYNFENNDYMHQGVRGDLQAGPLYHFNYSISKALPAIDPQFRVALVGYYLEQLSNDEFEGRDIPHSKEQVFAIGPGISWVHKGMFLGLKSHFETDAENRPQGIKTFLQIRFTF
ncbi:MAG: transporter [Desulfovermiculus sp.]